LSQVAKGGPERPRRKSEGGERTDIFLTGGKPRQSGINAKSASNGRKKKTVPPAALRRGKHPHLLGDGREGEGPDGRAEDQK